MYSIAMALNTISKEHVTGRTFTPEEAAEIVTALENLHTKLTASISYCDTCKLYKLWDLTPTCAIGNYIDDTSEQCADREPL